MKLNAVIIDDEPLGVKALTAQLHAYCPTINIVHSTTDPEAAVIYLHNNSDKVDILFLDIEMPAMDGFTLLTHLKEINYCIIFTTAYNKYAVEAFKVSAIDYLLKPIDEEELQASVNKVEKLKTKPNDFNNISKLLSNLPHHQGRRLAVPTLDGLFFVVYEDILYLVSSGNYTTLHLINQKVILCSKPLGYFERKLKGTKDFFRVHQSHLINITHVTNYTKGNGGYVVMSDKEVLNVSRAKKQDLLNLFDG